MSRKPKKNRRGSGGGAVTTADFCQAVDIEQAAIAVNNINHRQRTERREAREKKRQDRINGLLPKLPPFKEPE